VAVVPGVARADVPPRVVDVVERFFAFFLAVVVDGFRDVDVASDADDACRARVVVVPTLTLSPPLEHALASMISASAPQPTSPVRTRDVVTKRAYARPSRLTTNAG
jgi:hypothetical protein